MDFQMHCWGRWYQCLQVPEYWVANGQLQGQVLVSITAESCNFTLIWKDITLIAFSNKDREMHLNFLPNLFFFLGGFGEGMISILIWPCNNLLPHALTSSHGTCLTHIFPKKFLCANMCGENEMGTVEWFALVWSNGFPRAPWATWGVGILD